MALSDDNLARDPALAQMLAGASRDEPPAALDAAILAAARKAVGARPQIVGGGGDTSAPPVRAKRNWYVPASIAAVLVMSVSLVRLMQDEKGDELSQPPRSASAPQTTASAPPGVAPAPVAAPVAESAPAAADKADVMLRDAAPTQPKLAETKRAELPTATGASPAFPAPERSADLAKRQEAKKAEAVGDSAVALGNARKEPVLGGTSGVPAPAPAPAPARAQQLEPFPAAREREAPAASAGPTQLGRDAAQTRAPGTAQEAPAIAAAASAPPPVAPQAKVLAAPRRAAPIEDNQVPSAPAPAPAQAEGRTLAAPPPAIMMAKPAAPPPPAKPAVVPPRPVAWRGLDDQPPEKWLERLTEFRRDNRQADADDLLVEFRRRFPDHPSSAR